MILRSVLKGAGLVALAACGSDNCLTANCPIPLAVIVNVSSSISGTRVPGAFVQVNGSDVEPCNQSDTTVCSIYGLPGTYQIVVGAPGFPSITTTATYTATQTDACGCKTGTPTNVNVRLFVSPPPA